MKFNNVQVSNFEGAFRGLRNPLESWSKSDSYFGICTPQFDYYLDQVATYWGEQENLKRIKEGKEPYDIDEFDKLCDQYAFWLADQGIIHWGDDEESAERAYIGPVDLDLAQRMIRAGSSDRKFLRQIFVSVDITAPLYWWKEFDTYKIGTTANSTSTMHKLSSTLITKDCFEMEDLDENLMMYDDGPSQPDMYMSEYWDMLINDLEHLRKKYNETKSKYLDQKLYYLKKK